MPGVPTLRACHTAQLLVLRPLSASSHVRRLNGRRHSRCRRGQPSTMARRAPCAR
ncbi:hypothetical protein ACFPRL_12180 [Pseudoclavibacter helvolus]